MDLTYAVQHHSLLYMCPSTHVEMIHLSANLLKVLFSYAATELLFEVTSVCGSVLASSLSHMQHIFALPLSPFTADETQAGQTESNDGERAQQLPP